MIEENRANLRLENIVVLYVKFTGWDFWAFDNDA